MHSSHTDSELLRDFASTRSPEQFRQLVDRHLPAVHAAATRILRHCRPPLTGHVDDVAQSVFILLAQQAATLSGHTSLAGWLYRVTHYACLNVQRMESNRSRHEQEAGVMRSATSDPPTVSDAEALLDPGLLSLSEVDRAALLLRYTQNLSVEKIAAVTQVPAETAKKRLQRALGKLRNYFAAQGMLSAAPVALQALAPSPVPPALTGAIVTTALAPATAAAVKTSGYLISKGVMHMMNLAKLAKAAAVGVVVGSALLSSVLIMRAFPSPTAAASAPAPELAVVGPSQAQPPEPPEPLQPGFSAITEHTILSGNKPQITFIDFDHDKSFAPPFPVTINPKPFPLIDFTPELKGWIAQNNIHLVVVADERRVATTTIQTPSSDFADGGKPAFFAATPARAIIAEFDKRDPTLVTSYYETQRSDSSIPESHFFKTPAGNLGIYQILGPRRDEIYNSHPAVVRIRYKRVLPSVVALAHGNVGQWFNDTFPLATALAQQEAHGQIIAVHSLELAQDGILLVTVSTRLTDASLRELSRASFPPRRLGDFVQEPLGPLLEPEPRPDYTLLRLAAIHAESGVAAWYALVPRNGAGIKTPVPLHLELTSGYADATAWLKARGEEQTAKVEFVIGPGARDRPRSLLEFADALYADAQELGPLLSAASLVRSPLLRESPKWFHVAQRTVTPNSWSVSLVAPSEKYTREAFRQNLQHQVEAALPSVPSAPTPAEVP